MVSLEGIFNEITDFNKIDMNLYGLLKAEYMSYVL